MLRTTLRNILKFAESFVPGPGHSRKPLHRRRSPFRTSSHRLRLESLEDRLAPAVNGSLDNGALLVTLDEANDSAFVRLNATTIEIYDGTTVRFSTDAANVSSLSVTGTADANQSATLQDTITLSGTVDVSLVTSAAVEGTYSASSFDISATTATFAGGATGLLLSGPGIDLLNDTLGDIAFTGQTTYYIALANGAEYLAGGPAVIDATAVIFDGATATARSLAQLSVLQSMLIHFPDDGSVGKLFLVHRYSVSADAGADPRVLVFDAATDTPKLNFDAYDPTFHGGVRVASADVNGDGVDDVITGSGYGSAHVRVFDGITRRWGR